MYLTIPSPHDRSEPMPDTATTASHTHKAVVSPTKNHQPTFHSPQQYYFNPAQPPAYYKPWTTAAPVVHMQYYQQFPPPQAYYSPWTPPALALAPVPQDRQQQQPPPAYYSPWTTPVLAPASVPVPAKAKAPQYRRRHSQQYHHQQPANYVPWTAPAPAPESASEKPAQNPTFAFWYQHYRSLRLKADKKRLEQEETKASDTPL